jgi:hypothetical protein
LSINPQNYIRTTNLTGSIDSIASDALGIRTKITFKKDQPNILNNTQITLSGFTGYTGYNATFTVTKIDNRHIIINHTFHAEAVTTAATFSTIINDGIRNVNWNNSAPTTMSLYEYVEKYVPNGTIKGKIVITENEEIVNVPSSLDTFLQNAVEIISNIFNQN